MISQERAELDTNLFNDFVGVQKKEEDDGSFRKMPNGCVTLVGYWQSSETAIVPLQVTIEYCQSGYNKCLWNYLPGDQSYLSIEMHNKLKESVFIRLKIKGASSTLEVPPDSAIGLKYISKIPDSSLKIMNRPDRVFVLRFVNGAWVKTAKLDSIYRGRIPPRLSTKTRSRSTGDMQHMQQLQRIEEDKEEMQEAVPDAAWSVHDGQVFADHCFHPEKAGTSSPNCRRYQGIHGEM